MANKSTAQDTTQTDAKAPVKTMPQLQDTALSNMMGMGTFWIEAVSEMSAEVVQFVAERIKEDVKTQHEILHCRNAADLQHIQAQFLQKAMDQYQAETGKLVEMGTNAFASKTS
ncbi:phasin family protein [Octadecabacter sp. G9-8]|uniref:Phasin family protein n=1 Tax=Octadecabacter dasysiphoniae TaxID=2909341 RepID=A0ABS9CTX7_9RHOB|nr:phasin family protein [Octadecabacter dasysiphoniae]MCF2870401.1 phasin family protein [Octadecabacter dasysiphoniae]